MLSLGSFKTGAILLVRSWTLECEFILLALSACLIVLLQILAPLDHLQLYNYHTVLRSVS